MDESAKDRQVQVARDNITNMRRTGNTIVIGTDLFRKTARVEAELIASRHLMSNLELLQAWSVATPRAIFPHRKIGKLADGFEASFLVLAGDPLLEPVTKEKNCPVRGKGRSSQSRRYEAPSLRQLARLVF